MHWRWNLLALGLVTYVAICTACVGLYVAIVVFVSAVQSELEKSPSGSERTRTDAIVRDRAPRPFEKAAWDSEDGTARFQMAAFLVDSGELIGRPKAEIFDLLGFPSNEYRSIEGSDWHSGTDWRVGETERFPVNDKIIFSVFFDRKGICIEAKIRYPD